MSEVLRGLRLRRRAAGMNQGELGRLVGCSGAAVGAWERGEALPGADKLPEIAGALGCSIDELFAGGASPSPTQDENNKQEDI